jgi:lipid II:glycine glycyltransferase (peptidoglycan interpeptide bridge formation enzyme)
MTEQEARELLELTYEPDNINSDEMRYFINITIEEAKEQGLIKGKVKPTHFYTKGKNGLRIDNYQCTCANDYLFCVDYKFCPNCGCEIDWSET